MYTYHRNEEDPAPAVQIELDINDTGYLLSTPQWYVVEWTTDRSLFDPQNIFGRDESNFYPPDSAGNTHYTHMRTHVARLPNQVWERFASDPSNRRVYVRVGAGDRNDFNDPSWQWKELAKWIINHNPTANAGPPLEVSVIGGTAQQDVELSASGTIDPDPNSQLTYEWNLVMPPLQCWMSHTSFVSSLENKLKNGGEKVTLVNSGTAVPEPCQAMFKVKLEVTDDDPPSRYGTVGKGTDETLVTFGTGCSDGVCILSPTIADQAVIDKPGKDEVEIVWRLSSGNLQAWHQHPGAHLRLALYQSDGPSGAPPVYEDVSYSPRSRGSFFWRGYVKGGKMAPSGEYDIVLGLYEAQGLLIAGNDPSEATEVKAIGIDVYGSWSDLISFRPPHAVQSRVVNEPHFRYMHAIEQADDSSTATNLDLFQVLISKLPIINSQRVTAVELLDHIRRNFNDFVDTDLTEFLPYGGFSSEQTRWEAVNPLGAVLGLDFYFGTQGLPPDDGSVICSLYEPTRWRFSTLATLLDFEHPVSGNREWGVQSNGDGTHTFYTRAADRVTGFWDHPFLVYLGGELLWRSLQEKVAAFINDPSHDGIAVVLPPTIHKPEWPELKKAYFKPTITWLPGVT